MSFFSSFLLGLIQGIAEFLPISSSGHLAIAQNLLGMQDAGVVPEFFDVLLHLGGNDTFRFPRFFFEYRFKIL